MITLDNGGTIEDPLVMMDRAVWGAAPRRGTSASRGGNYEGLVLHHTAGELGLGGNQSASLLRGIQSFHQNTFGWTDFAYNLGVDSIGTLWEGRGFGFMNGANSPENSSTLSIVYLGNTEYHEFTEAAKRTVLKLVEYLEAPVSACPGGCGLWGHRELNPTLCPGKDAFAWIESGTPSACNC